MEGPIRRADRETASHDTTPLLFNATTAVRALRNCYPFTLRRPRPSLALLRLPPSSRPLSFRDRSLSFLFIAFLSRFLSSVRCWIYCWTLPKEISKDPSASNIYFCFFFFNRLSPLSKYYSVRHTFVELSRFTGRSLEVRSIRATGIVDEARRRRGGESARRDARVGELARYRRQGDATANPYSNVEASIGYHALLACRSRMSRAGMHLRRDVDDTRLVYIVSQSLNFYLAFR